MAARPQSTSGWSFGGGGSIWQGWENVSTRGRSDNHFDYPHWRRWHAAANNREQPLELPARSPSYPPVSSSSNLDVDLSTTLCMSDLEPWMDHEYASQVVRLMGWDSMSSNPNANGTLAIKIPPPPTDVVPQPNNPGYCLLTFPNTAHAANVLASLQSLNAKNPSATPLLMPNSTRPFNLQWAQSSHIMPVNPSPTYAGHFQGVVGGIGGVSHPAVAAANQSQQREYSIFVGDLAPEASNSDLVAVFRNPVLGLRNDREPKFIRPFYSCKSAKIMLDPVTGVSRGYGFVRFSDEADQQRALIEMHGLYCLSRPMRVSPATAKYKHNQSLHITPSFTPPVVSNPVTLSFPAPQTQNNEEQNGNDGDGTARASVVRSVSSPVAAVSTPSSTSATAVNNPNPSSSSSISTVAVTKSKRNVTAGSSPPLQSSGTPSSEQAVAANAHADSQNMPHILAQIAHLASGSGNTTAVDWNSAHEKAGGVPVLSNQPVPGTASNLGSYPSSSSVTSQPPPYPGQAAIFNTNSNPLKGEIGGPVGGIGEPGGSFDEAWTHQAQARAILGNMIGPNGEQLTSTDPYNTTVFVGGLSPLISEETLRTFFAPFGDIHYVKVPLGKHCGFVQFVRKADAERAIERMQGFPIGGSRIRLSWGRSQYKAAQAAAQAAQAAQIEQAARAAAAASAAASNGQTGTSLQLTPDQAMLLLQSMGYNPSTAPAMLPPASGYPFVPGPPGMCASVAAFNEMNPDILYGYSTAQERSDFTPFSPSQPTNSPFIGQDHQHPFVTPSPSQALPHPSRSYAPGFGPGQTPASANFSDTNSPHSSSTESSSSSSSVRFSGIGGGAFPSSGFLEKPSMSFQANDVLRHDTQSFLRPSASNPQLQSEEQATRVQSPRQQPQPHAHGPRNDTFGEFVQDMNGTLASLDLGEKYSRAAIGSEMLKKDGHPLGGEKGSLSTSISAPLRNFTSPRPLSGSTPGST